VKNITEIMAKGEAARKVASGETEEIKTDALRESVKKYKP
jgi:hypothetical protein